MGLSAAATAGLLRCRQLAGVSDLQSETPARTGQHMEDSQLVREFLRTQDPRLFETLVERYKSRVYRLALSILGPGFSSEAEDVAQEVFLLVYRHLPTFRMEHRFSTWLYRITYNRTIDEKRKARMRLPHLSEEALHSQPARRNEADPFYAAFRDERNWAVVSCIQELPDTYRSVLYLHYWMGCSIEEIGEFLTLNIGTVKSYLFRARERLHDRLKKRGVIYE